MDVERETASVRQQGATAGAQRQEKPSKQMAKFLRMFRISPYLAIREFGKGFLDRAVEAGYIVKKDGGPK